MIAGVTIGPRQREMVAIVRLVCAPRRLRLLEPSPPIREGSALLIRQVHSDQPGSTPQGFGEGSDIVLGLGTIPDNGVHEAVAVRLELIVIAVAGQTAEGRYGGSLAFSRHNAHLGKAGNGGGCCCDVGLMT